MWPRARRILPAWVMLLLMMANVAAAETSGQLFAEPLPGTPPFDTELIQALRSKWAARDPQYQPRTRHLRPDGSPKYTNRLFLEASPYLLQHAHNPVNWYPWGDEAFATARKLGRPVVVSIGYSTCHWCHVMEEESFEDETIARYLNEHYIAIKVDREERPDIDGIYMQAVRMLTGQAGLPMTVWLTPDRKPFYGGTYVPPRDGDRGYPVGFHTLLQELKRIYHEQPDRVAEASAEISRFLQSALKPVAAEEALPSATVLHDAARLYRRNFDSKYGGINAEQKFPSSLPIRFLLRYHRRTGDAQYLKMATLTLEKMAAGGMYDHVGDGFHRYATDKRWQVPHFEKMLYDNALLALAYLEGYQATGREDFAQTARDILRYVAREMTSPEGGFYSANDADSLAPGGHREEGRFFTWTPAEIEAVLGKQRARIVTAYYAVTAEGNFEGRNVLHTPRSLDAVAKDLKLKPTRLREAIEESKELLYAARQQRPAPLRDEKILVAWNGLMIGAYARAALALSDPAYAGQAARAADFILTSMRRDGRLLRSYKDGLARHNAYLDDYAFFIAGLLDVFEATGELRWLKEAVELDGILEKFYADQAGGYFLTSSDHETLLAREKPAHDGAEPSGNSVQLLNLLRLSEFTTNDRYRQRAERTLHAFSAQLARAPAALSEMLLAVDYHLDTPKEVVVVTPSNRGEAEPFLAKLGTVFLPNRVLVVAPEGEVLKAQGKMIPFLEGKLARNGKATAYVCERQVCKFPTDDPAVFARQIQEVRPLDAAPDGKTSP